MKLFPIDNINAIEQQMLAERDMSKLDFIETIGQAVADEIASTYDSRMPTVVFAGHDDCGAYALTAARLLFDKGFSPYVFLFNIGGNKLTQECIICRQRYIDCSSDDILTEVTGMRFAMPELDRDMLVIDGLFGSSLAGTLSRGYQILVSNINESGATIVSIDIPSGLPADPAAGLINSKIIHADTTLAIAMPRLSFFIDENIELVGHWKPIGPKPEPSLIRRTRSSSFLIESKDIRGILQPRRLNSSKADYGSAIIFAGSYGMMGAAVLATRAASRSGCGKVTCHSPQCGYGIIQSSVPSALFESDQGENDIRTIELHRNYSAIAIGPGIGTSDKTIQAIEDFLKIASANRRPVLLDADALNCIAFRPSMLNYLPILSIITPHAGEFDRIFGPQPSSSARLAKAIEVARTYKIIVVLKGYYTATIRPDGKVFYNSSGTPALATAGSGDVLTGLMVGLLAQGIKPEIASVAAVHIHGIAGKIAEQTHGEYGVTADDVAECIGRAIKSIMDNN